MGEVRQLDVFGGETPVVVPPSPWLVEEPVVVRREVPSWWVQEELPLFER
jgi:hypothetical protein